MIDSVYLLLALLIQAGPKRLSLTVSPGRLTKELFQMPSKMLEVILGKSALFDQCLRSG